MAVRAYDIEQPPREQRSVSIEVLDLTLTPEEAQELRERLEHPQAFPTRQPRAVARGDVATLRRLPR